MITFALLLLQIPTPAPQSPPEPDVVVIGKRLEAWRGRVSTTFGITTCKTTLSTGDKDIDEVGCTAFKRCWSQYRPQLSSARKRQGDGESDARKIEAEIGQCLKSTRYALVDQLVARRRGDVSE